MPMTDQTKDLRPLIATIIDKHEKDFESSKGGGVLPFPEEHVDAARREFKNLRYHLLTSRDSIDKYEAETLKEQLVNKIGLSLTEQVHPDDWWWTPSSEAVTDVLSEVHGALEEATGSKTKKWWAVLKYVWRVLIQILYLGIVVGVFSSASSKFETIIFALLVLIYNSVSFSRLGLANGLDRLTHQAIDTYGELARTLKMKIPVTLRVESAKQLEETTIQSMIHVIAVGIGTLISLWHLVTAIL